MQTQSLISNKIFISPQSKMKKYLRNSNINYAALTLEIPQAEQKKVDPVQPSICYDFDLGSLITSQSKFELDIDDMQDFFYNLGGPICSSYRAKNTYNSKILFPISKFISSQEKYHLSYYAKNYDYENDDWLVSIRKSFCLRKHTKIIVQCINTIQSLMNTGGIYCRAVLVIKRKLRDTLNEADLQKSMNEQGLCLKTADMDQFIDKIVQLSRYRASFSFKSETKSIEKLKEFFMVFMDTSFYRNSFLGLNKINNDKPLENLNLHLCELADYTQGL